MRIFFAYLIVILAIAGLALWMILAIARVTSREPCNIYHVTAIVDYTDGTSDTLMLKGSVRGNYYIGEDNPFPDRPKVEIVSIRGIGCLVHYPDCRDEEKMSIAAWNVGRYRILDHSRGGMYKIEPKTYESNTLARSVLTDEQKR